MASLLRSGANGSALVPSLSKQRTSIAACADPQYGSVSSIFQGNGDRGTRRRRGFSEGFPANLEARWNALWASYPSHAQPLLKLVDSSPRQARPTVWRCALSSIEEH